MGRPPSKRVTTVTDEIPLNVGSIFNATLLNLVVNFLAFKEEVEVPTTLAQQDRSYALLRTGLGSIIDFLIWSKRYDDKELKEFVKKLEAINPQYTEDGVRQIKELYRELGFFARERSPLDRDVKRTPTGEMFV